MKRLSLRSISIVAATAFAATFFGLIASNVSKTEAIKATDFKAGRIIDDSIFYNADTMTVEQIQGHLDKYSPTCDFWGEGAVGSGRSINGKAVPANTTRREYARMKREAGASNYHDAPYVCVNKYYENPETHETLYETNGEIKPGMISAAQIIYDAAQKYSINPQVLLVLLKKESYVWGDNWPLKWEYNTVMGYACPDGAPCDSKYFGFYNQTMTAAWQLNYYKSHIYSYNYRPYQTNQILYSPDWSCGRKEVYLENIATTSLYIYTPYTPNDAALANYPGTSYCGSYGNRNFFMYFAEWFGSTLGTSWSPMGAPRYLEVAAGAKTRDVTSGASEDVATGILKRFTSKATIGDDLCLRTEEDEKNGIQKCILYKDLKDVTLSWTPMAMPRFMRTTADTKKYNNETGKGEDLAAGNVAKYSSKITTKEGKVCVRSDADENAGLPNCVLLEYLENSDPEWETMAMPRHLRTTRKTKKTDVVSNASETVAVNDVAYYTSKITLGGKDLCLRSDADKKANSQKCVIMSDLEDADVEWEEMAMPRYYEVKSGAKLQNAMTKTAAEDATPGAILYYVEKTTINGELCLRSQNNKKNNAQKCVYTKDLNDASLVWTDITPVYMKTSKNTQAITLDGKKVSDLAVDDIAQYSSKRITTNGQWCWRTSSDTKAQAEKCVPADALIEAKAEWSDMAIPRYMITQSSTSYINPISLEKTGTVSGTAFYTQKTQTRNGDLCLRADNMPKDYCVLFSNLRDR